MRTAAAAAGQIARAIKALERPRLNSLTKDYVIIELKEVHEYLKGLVKHPPTGDGDIY